MTIVLHIVQAHTHTSFVLVQNFIFVFTAKTRIRDTQRGRKNTENKKQLLHWCESKRFNYLSNTGCNTHLTHC